MLISTDLCFANILNATIKKINNLRSLEVKLEMCFVRVWRYKYCFHNSLKKWNSYKNKENQMPEYLIRFIVD